MKILCLTTFLDGTRRFEKDDQCTVDDAAAYCYIAHGWAKPVESTTLGATDLVIQNTKSSLLPMTSPST